MQVWVATENGNLEVTYTHNEEHVCCLINQLCMLYFDLMQLIVRRKGVWGQTREGDKNECRGDHQWSFPYGLC